MTKDANSLRKLTLSTAVAALLAAPLAVQAQNADLGADVGADVSAGVAGAEAGVSADVNGTVGADTDLLGEPEVAETLPLETDTDIDAAVEGAVAVASDDTVLGTIAGAEPQADGSVRYSIDLAEGFAVDTPRAMVQITQDIDADGQLVIGMTGEEFATALAQKTSATGAAQTQTN